MDDSEKLSLYFVQDGGPLDEICGVSGCLEKAVGLFLAFSYETDEEVGVMNLCDSHAAQLATAYCSTTAARMEENSERSKQ